MTRRHPLTILTASMALGVATAAVLSGCSGSETPVGTPSASASATASSTPTRSAAPLPTPEPSDPSDDQTGSADDGTGPGTGNGSGAQAPANVDFGKISKQGIAAAGGGTVVSLAGSGDAWTVVVDGPDGSLTQAVVSATLDRVTSGPFPKDSDAATKTANVARAAALKVDATAAASRAASAAGGTVSAVTLGGSGTAPTWTVAVTVGGAARTVTVNGVTGATS
ncbi:hypothetical protein ACTJKO_08860 [Curtobacterium sp. 22159]|uniref:hypothetical protein n=1 Tax=Curtobacterium sp. 22159 TaxID=3453882 RepID=UPI003F82B329